MLSAAPVEKSNSKVASLAPDSPDSLEFSTGASVFCTDGLLGTLQEVVADAGSGRITHLVVRTGWIFSRALSIPLNAVRQASREQVELSWSCDRARRTEEYRSDNELEAAIRAAWETDRALHTQQILSCLAVTARDGLAVLRGYVSQETHVRRLVELTGGVPGVHEVRCEVVSDEELRLEVAQALNTDSRTHALQPVVDSRFGHVRLSGETSDPHAAAVATDVVSAIPRVRSITNLLHAAGTPEPPAPAPPAYDPPRVGQHVLAGDGELGIVEHVVLDRHNRRLVGLVVAGNLPSPPVDDPDAHPENWPHSSRRVLIPGEWIDTVANEVLLNVELWDAAEAPEIPQGRYVTPPSSWGAPFPYELNEVLIEQEYPAPAFVV